jgi:predicted phage tail component-like protein
VDVNTADGVLFSNTTYDKKDISVSFVFEGISEAGLQALRQWLNTKQICDLVFDEEPYKVWSAKTSGYVSIKHLCFEIDG